MVDKEFNLANPRRNSIADLSRQDGLDGSLALSDAILLIILINALVLDPELMTERAGLQKGTAWWDLMQFAYS